MINNNKSALDEADMTSWVDTDKIQVHSYVDRLTLHCKPIKKQNKGKNNELSLKAWLVHSFCPQHENE